MVFVSSFEYLSHLHSPILFERLIARFSSLIYSVFQLGDIIHTCFLEQLWDLRTKTAVMDMKENEDYISDMAVDDQQKFLLATRYIYT